MASARAETIEDYSERVKTCVAPGAIESVTLSELLSALSYALDITEGQPEGHCVRVCWIGTHIGREYGLTDQQIWELYYTLLLKDLGCSSNAARISDLYLTDDRQFKKDYKTVEPGLPGALDFIINHTGMNSDFAKRLKAIAKVMVNNKSVAHELIETRCTRGAAIARQLRFPERVAEGIHFLDEHWDGSGHPEGRSHDEIPVYSRIALLAQVIDVFYTAGSREAAIGEALNRSNSWFDPMLVSAFMRISKSVWFWNGLAAPNLEELIFALEPARHRVNLDDQYIDDIAIAFGQVIDAKSPYTAGHSSRVADYADRIGRYLGMDKQALRWLRRGALLHDVGKLGVSNMILDKPGKLDDEEWKIMQGHAIQSEKILSRIGVFKDMAQKSAAHHERPDGKGYPYGLRDQDISLETRIITIADFFDALTADRPYRKAMAVEQALCVIEAEVGGAIDTRCFAALQAVIGPLESFSDHLHQHSSMAFRQSV